MKLLSQPDEGSSQLLKILGEAKKSIEIVIFRFDRRDLENALKDAMSRGVFVHALIAHTNRGGEAHLRKLEMRLLEAGGTVARTADDLLRYHYKMIIIDRRVLCLLAFNFTYLDMEHSRSFGVITQNWRLVQEAVRLFEADTRRQPYTPGYSSFLVSPVNARKELSLFIHGARKQLLIYDPRVGDRTMIRLLEERAKAGVDVRILGRVSGNSKRLAVRKLAGMRLHTRTILRDGRAAFVGSQSLRKVELDNRREVGIVFHDLKVVPRLVKTFEEDWAAAGLFEANAAGMQQNVPLNKAAKQVAEAVAKDLPQVAQVLKEAVEKVVGNATEVDLDAEEIQETVKDAVKEAVQEAVKEVVEDAVGSTEEEPVRK